MLVLHVEEGRGTRRVRPVVRVLYLKSGKVILVGYV